MFNFWDICPAGNQVVHPDFTAEDSFCVGSGLPDCLIFGEIGMEDVDIRAGPELLRHSLLGAGLVADKTDDGVVGVLGNLFEELELPGEMLESSVLPWPRTQRNKCIPLFPWRLR